MMAVVVIEPSSIDHGLVIGLGILRVRVGQWPSHVERGPTWGIPTLPLCGKESQRQGKDQPGTSGRRPDRKIVTLSEVLLPEFPEPVGIQTGGCRQRTLP